MMDVRRTAIYGPTLLDLTVSYIRPEGTAITKVTERDQVRKNKTINQQLVYQSVVYRTMVKTDKCKISNLV